MNEKTAEKTSLEIIRFISASPARVYDAWTDPAQLREWFGPENVRTRKITADVRVHRGGTELRLNHEQLPSEESRDRHNEGWKSLLDRLEQFLSE